MWVFVSLVVGLVVAVAVLASELRKARAWQRGRVRARRVWQALTGPAEPLAPAPWVVLSHEPAPAHVPRRSERWCSGGAQLAPCRASGTSSARARTPAALAPTSPRSTILPLSAPAARNPRLAEPLGAGHDLALEASAEDDSQDELWIDDEAPISAPVAARAKPTSGFQLVSRPGDLVLPESYGLAPPLPAGAILGSDALDRSDRSVEVMLEDLEDLVDTQPSVVLSPAEAASILAAANGYQAEPDEEHESECITTPPPTRRRSALPPPPSLPGSGRKSALPIPPPSDTAWDQRATQPKPTPRLDEIFQDAPTGRGALLREQPEDTRRRAG